MKEEGEAWLLLLGAVIRQALNDMTRTPDRYRLIDPGASRRWLLDTGPWLLEQMDLPPEYSGRLRALVEGVPEPDTYQLAFDLLEVA